MGGLKKKIIEFNIIPYKCIECGIENQWNNKFISLQLDHKNGNSTDWRLDNLRFLCPNCHSQTDTYSGKKHKIRYYCKTCKTETTGYTNHCFSVVIKRKEK